MDRLRFAHHQSKEHRADPSLQDCETDWCAAIDCLAACHSKTLEVKLYQKRISNHDGDISLIEVGSTQLDGEDALANCLKWNGSGTRVLLGLEDGTIRILHVAAKVRKELPTAREEHSIAPSTGGPVYEIYEIGAFMAHRHDEWSYKGVNHIAFHPCDDSIFASSGEDTTIKVWRLLEEEDKDNKCRARVVHTVDYSETYNCYKITCLAWSPDGAVLAAGKYHYDSISACSPHNSSWEGYKQHVVFIPIRYKNFGELFFPEPREGFAFEVPQEPEAIDWNPVMGDGRMMIAVVTDGDVMLLSVMEHDENDDNDSSNDDGHHPRHMGTFQLSDSWHDVRWSSSGDMIAVYSEYVSLQGMQLWSVNNASTVDPRNDEDDGDTKKKAASSYFFVAEFLGNKELEHVEFLPDDCGVLAFEPNGIVNELRWQVPSLEDLCRKTIRSCCDVGGLPLHLVEHLDL